MTKQIFIFLVLCAHLTNLTAQEQIGSRLTNFSGSQAYAINPAFAASALDWDVNLAHVGLFAATDYAYFPQTNLFALIKSAQNSTTVSPVYAVNQQTDATMSLRVQGPSFLARAGSLSFGFSTAARVAFFADNVDRQLGYHDYAQIPIGGTVKVEPLDLGAMAWTEYGLYLGKTILDSRLMDVKIGGHFKYLQAYEAVYFKSEQNASFVKGAQSNNFFDMNVLLAYSMDDSDPDYTFGQNKGSGFGADIGISYEVKPDFRRGTKIVEDNKNDYQYDWKLGVSLIDLGRVSFDQAKFYSFQESEPVAISEQQIEAVDGVAAFGELLIDQVYQGDETRAIAANKLKLWTPAALSIQYDRYLNHNLYFNALVVRRLPLALGIKRANIFAGTLRYERKFVGVSVPLVLYNDKDLRVGTAVRLGWFEVGSDDVMSLIGQSRLNSTSIYAGLKINDFSIKAKSSQKNKRSGKEPPCPQFN